jgi:hypothetical protein
MTLYTFYPCHTDGGSSTFAVFDLDADDQVPAIAQAILADHLHCAYVAVWEGDRPVMTSHRYAPGRDAGIAADRAPSRA